MEGRNGLRLVPIVPELFWLLNFQSSYGFFIYIYFLR